MITQHILGMSTFEKTFLAFCTHQEDKIPKHTNKHEAISKLIASGQHSAIQIGSKKEHIKENTKGKS
jgi:hypothetical protein